MYTHIYIHIYIYSHEEASVGGEAAAAGEAGDGGNGYKDRRAPSFLEKKKKEKEKLVARLKSKHISLLLHDNVSRDEFGRYNYLCSCARVPAFSNAPPFLSFLWSPLEEGGPFEFFFEKNPNTLLQRPRFSNLFFFTSTEKVKSPRNCARALKSSA